MTAFWIQTLAGIAAGLFVLLVQLIGSRAGRWTPRRAPVPINSNNVTESEFGTQGPVDGGNAEPGAMPGARITKATVINNISYSEKRIVQTASSHNNDNSSDDVWGKLAIWVIGLIAAAGLFLIFHQILLGLTVGVAAGLVVSAIIAVVRTKRRLDYWPASASLTLIDLAFVLVAAAVTWTGVYSTTRNALGLFKMQSSSPSYSSNPDSITKYIDGVLSQIVELVQSYGMKGINFLVLLLLATLVIGTLLIFLCFDVFGWHAYLGFGPRYSQRKLLVREATRFSKMKWSRSMWTLVLATMAIACASGVVFDLINRATHL